MGIISWSGYNVKGSVWLRMQLDPSVPTVLEAAAASYVCRCYLCLLLSAQYSTVQYSTVTNWIRWINSHWSNCSTVTSYLWVTWCSSILGYILTFEFPRWYVCNKYGEFPKVCSVWSGAGLKNYWTGPLIWSPSILRSFKYSPLPTVEFRVSIP
jgi:hypothetical protein